jgi:hypothetical protein
MRNHDLIKPVRLFLAVSTALWACVLCVAASAMTYHDNVVDMPLDVKDYTVVTATYTISAFKISDGQDPDGKIYVGYSQTYTGNKGKMSFTVGRHKTKPVATWFTSQVPKDRNTYNDDPKELNFAFIGTLKMTLTGGVLGSNQDTYTLNNMAFGQGSAFLDNDWWFGGKDCTFDKKNEVVCVGYSTAKYPVKFRFKRGGNNDHTVSNNEIVYTPYATYPLHSHYVGESVFCVWQPDERCPPYIVYYDDPNAAPPKGIKLTVSGNLLYLPNGLLFDTSGADPVFGPSGQSIVAAIFVMTPDGTLYASRQSKTYLFHHSTLYGGRAIASAGTLQASNGVLSRMTNCSGHYRPPDYSYDQLREQLDRMGYTRSFSFASCGLGDYDNYPEQ